MWCFDFAGAVVERAGAEVLRGSEVEGGTETEGVVGRDIVG
jgi:hypothetical protein